MSSLEACNLVLGTYLILELGYMALIWSVFFQSSLLLIYVRCQAN